MMSEIAQSQAGGPSQGQGLQASSSEQTASIAKIQTLLRANDDTSRFVGLALLKSVLDNSVELREDEDTLISLWESIPPKFVDRLLRTGNKESSSTEDGASKSRNRDMLDLAVSVMHTFVALLPGRAARDSSMIGRIPLLVASLLHCSGDTLKAALETLISLVSKPEGAKVFVGVQDLTPLTENAPSQPLTLDVLLHAWLNAMPAANKDHLRSIIDQTIGNLVSSFKGTDGVTLLAFLADLLPRLEPEVLPPNPSWLPSVSKFIFQLVISRPTASSRAAFTNLSAALLETYPLQAPPLLFANDTPNDEKPLSYLLINLILVDLRSSLPLLLEQLNTPLYQPTAHRLTSAFNILTNYTGFLLRSSSSSVLSPSHLLKLRTLISETLSVTIEFLRDRYDASTAGALGLHPSARTSDHISLTWDSADAATTLANDPLTLAAVRSLAIWLREDDNDMLRREAAGLVDLLLDLYQSTSDHPFRRPVLVALEGITAEKKGRDAFLDNNGWDVLAGDMLSILTSSDKTDEKEAETGVEIVRVLIHVAETESPGPREAWMDLVTKVAAWYYVPPPGDKNVGMAEEFQVAVLQLVTALLVGTHPGVRRRYVHSTSAVLGIAKVLRERIVRGGGEAGLVEGLDDVLVTLGGL
ncbi:e9b59b6a-f39c-4d2a-9b94-75afe2ab05bc [Echria macrotheca]|uniref:E9b59b6a-f39c-4d2a-9b94-75afe2ab05bc n=1 Tax=Echria macrotheca TaxID=438768 RepID=A0AAJ0B4J6_9PEZI|nr:e9b59b6a-f39c-4d2a-9b94-75afe2ab05bc [Echria macrotheca]